MVWLRISVLLFTVAWSGQWASSALWAGGVIDAQNANPPQAAVDGPDGARSPTGLFTSVMDYGCKGDGNSDDTPCVTLAYRATPKFGTLLFPEGRVFKFRGLVVEKPMALNITGRIIITDTLDICSGGVTVYGSSPGAFTNQWNLPTSVTWNGESAGVMIRAGGCDARGGMFGIHIRDLGLDGRQVANVIGLQLGNASPSNPDVGATFSTFENLMIQGTFKAIDIQRGSEQNHFSKIVIGGRPNKMIVPGSIGICVACTEGSTNVTTNYFDRMTLSGHDTLLKIGGAGRKLRPVTTVVTNSIFNVTDKASTDISVLNGMHIVIENNYFETNTSLRTPIILGSATYPRSNSQIPQGVFIQHNLFSGGDSTKGPAPFINAHRFNKLWVVDNLYGGSAPGPASTFIYNDPTEGWSGAHRGGTFLHNRATDTGVAIEIGPKLDGWDVVEFQGGTAQIAYADSHPYIATDARFSKNLSMTGAGAVLQLPDNGVLSFRNHANTSDITAVKKDADDNLYLGDAAANDIFLNLAGGTAIAIKHSSKLVGVGTTDPKVSGTGLFHASGDTARPFDTSRTPKNLVPGEGDSCNTGEVFYDADYIYICVKGSMNNTSTIKKATLK